MNIRILSLFGWIRILLEYVLHLWFSARENIKCAFTCCDCWQHLMLHRKTKRAFCIFSVKEIMLSLFSALKTPMFLMLNKTVVSMREYCVLSLRELRYNVVFSVCEHCILNVEVCCVLNDRKEHRVLTDSSVWKTILSQCEVTYCLLIREHYALNTRTLHSRYERTLCSR